MGSLIFEEKDVLCLHPGLRVERGKPIQEDTNRYHPERVFYGYFRT